MQSITRRNAPEPACAFDIPRTVDAARRAAFRPAPTLVTLLVTIVPSYAFGDPLADIDLQHGGRADAGYTTQFTTDEFFQEYFDEQDVGVTSAQVEIERTLVDFEGVYEAKSSASLLGTSMSIEGSYGGFALGNRTHTGAVLWDTLIFDLPQGVGSTTVSFELNVDGAFSLFCNDFCAPGDGFAASYPNSWSIRLHDGRGPVTAPPIATVLGSVASADEFLKIDSTSFFEDTIKIDWNVTEGQAFKVGYLVQMQCSLTDPAGECVYGLDGIGGITATPGVSFLSSSGVFPGSTDGGVFCIGNCAYTDALEVGSFDLGDGSLSLLNRSLSVSGDGTVGSFGADAGTIELKGAGSVLGIGGGSGSTLHVGTSGGQGRIDIMDGASLVLSSRDAGDDPAGMSAFVGWGGQGIVNVEAGSSLMISDTHDYIDADTEGLLLSIGSPRNGAAGFGSLTARGIGAEILLDGNNASIGVGVTNNAITGPGDAYGELRVLDRAHLGLDARDGAAHFVVGSGGDATGLGIGDVLVSTGFLTIDGGTAARLFIGSDGPGTVGHGVGRMSIVKGGIVTVDASDGDAEVVVGNGLGTGQLTVAEGGALFVDGNIRISANNALSGNSTQRGAVYINGTGTVAATGTTYVGNGTTPDINGLLCGTGTLQSDVVVQTGGMLCPGASPGTFNVVGDVVFDGGSLEIEIAGAVAGLFDSLVVSGTLDLTNANILFSFLDGFVPSQGDTFDFLTAQTITGFSMARFDYFGAPTGFFFDFFERDGVLRAAASVASVPEPAGVALLLAGLGALGLARRRRAGENAGAPRSRNSRAPTIPAIPLASA